MMPDLPFHQAAMENVYGARVAIIPRQRHDGATIEVLRSTSEVGAHDIPQLGLITRATWLGTMQRDPGPGNQSRGDGLRRWPMTGTDLDASASADFGDEKGNGNGE